MAVQLRTRRERSEAGARRSYPLLPWASALYAIGIIAHTADHLRRGTDVLTPEVLWAGNVSTMAGVVVIALVLARQRAAPYIAAAFGAAVSVGVSAVHLLPHWSAFSDAFPGSHGAGVSPISWVVVLLEIIGALSMTVAVLAPELRRSNHILH